MSLDMTGRCRNHSFESAISICHRCGAEYCGDCLVHPFGPAKPFCKNCAMNLAGVRTHTTLPAISQRQIRTRAKAFAATIRTVILVDQPIEQLIADPELVACATSAQPADGVAPPIDWSRPFD